MSIYPVLLSEWFPLGDEQHEIAFLMVKTSRCLSCMKRIRWKKAVGHHSIPWGNGDIWCSWKCCKSNKIGWFDRRQMRSINRRSKDKFPLFIDIKPSK